ncbi:FecCD family ABC transporter permease [Paenibacillus massiliensis]|uniref:FecCD family ABC transporter permease n=1 Tax=Paenibacillus massiliensis TaxID=225917 RepID=UPI0004287B8A|nr:iron ABC transporter permease [Paenibacillus massiliensis]
MSGWLNSRTGRLAGLGVGIVALLGIMLASVLFGLQQFSLRELWQAYRHFDGSNEHLILLNTRVPRTLIAVVVGASLAVAGTIMQVLTKNPLASPSVFGVNSGAVLFIVIGLAVTGSSLTMTSMIGLAFIGAALTSLFVYVLSMQGRGGFEPIRLTLAGASVAAFASSVTSGLILINKQSLESALFWMVGSVSGRNTEHLLLVLPYIVAGLILSFLLAGSLNVLALGDEQAKGLGQRLTLIRLGCTAAVVLLAGSAVAAAGPIAFIGLVIPHLCRYAVGNDHRWLLPYAAVSGALLLVSADLASRFILVSKEVPVGVATALIGVPFLIHVARRRKYA